MGYSVTMPTILRQDGFAVMIHTDDHAPPHVHCYGENAVVVIELESLNVRRRKGSDRDVQVARAIVEEHRALLLREWERIHGEN